MVNSTIAVSGPDPTPPIQEAGSRSGPAVYEIIVRGHLDDRWSTWLGGMTLHHDGEGYTQLAGTIPDQAALFGILLQIRDLGLSLIALQRVTARRP